MTKSNKMDMAETHDTQRALRAFLESKNLSTITRDVIVTKTKGKTLTSLYLHLQEIARLELNTSGNKNFFVRFPDSIVLDISVREINNICEEAFGETPFVLKRNGSEYVMGNTKKLRVGGWHHLAQFISK